MKRFTGMYNQQLTNIYLQIIEEKVFHISILFQRNTKYFPNLSFFLNLNSIKLNIFIDMVG